MKRFNIIIFSIITATAFLACSLEIPKKVSVKTDAEYNFSIGDVENDSLSENFKPSELFASVEGVEVLDYCPDGDETLQQFLLKIPITSIPIDFSSYFNSLDLSGQISSMSFSQSMTVPSSLTAPLEQSLPLDSINNAINKGVSIGGRATTTGASISYAVDATGGATDFTSIEYESGSMTISELISGTITDGTTVTLTFADSTMLTGTFSNGSATLNMAGKKITKTGMSIRFSGCAGIVYTGIMDSNSQIKEAIGVTLNSSDVSISVDPFTIKQGASLGYKSCTVGEGSLIVGLNTPDSWSGLNVEYQIETSGGLVIDGDTPGSSGNSKTISLDGKTLLPQDITVTPTIKATLSNATINFEDEMTVSMQANITTISSLTAEISSEGFNPSINFSNPLPDGMMNYIESISFEECGLKGTYTNSLPEGNSVSFTTNSNFFGLSNNVSTLEGGKTADLNITSTNQKIVLGSEAGQYNSIDFSAEIALPGADSEHPNQFTISNVKVGETYTIAVELEPVLNWTEVTIKTNDVTSQSQQISTGMNIVSLFSSFESTLGDASFTGKFKIDSLPVYLYIVKPELSLLDDVCFNGSLKAFYATQDENGTITQKTADGDVVEIKSNNSEGSVFSFVSSMPDFATNSDGVVIKDIGTYPCSASVDFAPLSYDENATDDSFIFVDYNLQLASSKGNSISIKKEDLEKSVTSSTEIAINAVIALPLKVTTTSAISFDLLALTNNNGGDLFGRTEAPDLGQMQDLLEVIEEVTLSYSITNKPFYSDPSMKLYINLNDGGHIYNLSEDTFVLSEDAIESLLQYPCRPEVCIKIDNGTVFKIPRTMKIGAHINLSLKTNGDKAITIFDAGGN